MLLNGWNGYTPSLLLNPIPHLNKIYILQMRKGFRKVNYTYTLGVLYRGLQVATQSHRQGQLQGW